MILDSYSVFDPAASALTVTRDSTNILDLLNAGDYGIAGEDHPLKIIVIGDKAFASSGSSATCTIALQSAPNSAGSPGTWTVAAEIPTLSTAIMAANYKLWSIDLPHRRPGADLPRFYKLVYTVASGPFTAGTLQAYLDLGNDANVPYPSGFSTAYI